MRHLTIDLGHPALIGLTGAPAAPAQSLGRLFLDGLRALEREAVVHRRRGQEHQVDRLAFDGLLHALALHRVVPAVDQRRVALKVALPRRVRPVRAAPVFPPDLFF